MKEIRLESNSFNALVPQHEATELLQEIVELSSTVGRLRYMWVDKEEKKIKALFKNGPDSWVSKEDNEKFQKDLNALSKFEKLTTVERDPVYVTATFSLTEKEFSALEIADVASKERFEDEYERSLFEDPFDIFDDNIEKMKNNTLTGKPLKAVTKLQEDFMSKIKNLGL